MLESWLQLDQRPFCAAPHASHYFAAESIESTRVAIHGCMDRGAGPCTVIGPAGAGKTMLTLTLQDHFRAKTPFALVGGKELKSRQELLQSMLYEFGLPFRGVQEPELRLSLLDFLTSRDASQSAAMLVVDDGDALSTELLQDVASLTSHSRDGNWCLNLVLLGTIRLEELLSAPGLTSFQQRIACRNYLGNWSTAETESFIRDQLQRVSIDQIRLPAFDADVCRRVHELTDGVPRLVNQLCEHVLMTSSLDHEEVVSSDQVVSAWYDLQQLPIPQTAQPRSNAQADAHPDDHDFVEFGELVDESDASSGGTGSTDGPSTHLDVMEDGLQQMGHDAAIEPTPDPPTVANHVEEDTIPEAIESVAPVDTCADQVIQADESAHDSFHNPFAEMFLEEKLVCNDACELNVPQVDHRPLISSDEGPALSEIVPVAEDAEITAEAHRPAFVASENAPIPAPPVPVTPVDPDLLAVQGCDATAVPLELADDAFGAWEFPVAAPSSFPSSIPPAESQPTSEEPAPAPKPRRHRRLFTRLVHGA